MDDVDVRVPESIQVLRDFVNSVEFQVNEDEFETPDQLAGWLTERGLLEPFTSLTTADVETAQTVREGLRSVLHLHAGHEADGPAIDRMSAALATMPTFFSFDHAGRSHVTVTGGGGLNLMVDVLVKAITAAQVDGSWERLKACARESCQWAFYDASRNRSGRWCSMAGCGNYIKMRRVAERRSETKTHIAPSGSRSEN